MKLGPPALTAVPQEGELADDEHSAADVEQRAVHFSVVVWKDPQADDLAGQINDVLLRVPLGHSEQDQQSFLDSAHDFMGNGHTRPRNSLYDGPHGMLL